jgi:hypothetical protein
MLWPISSILKEQYHEIFDPFVFFIIQPPPPPQAPD